MTITTTTIAPIPSIPPLPMRPLAGGTFGIIQNVEPIIPRDLLKLVSTSGEVDTLFAWPDQLSAKRFPFFLVEVGRKWKESTPQEFKEYVSPSASSYFTKRPSLRELVLYSQVALPKAEVISLGLAKSIDEEEIKMKEFEGSFQSTQ